VILKKPSFRFSWYHRDELQIVGVVVLLVLFFSRSEALSVFTLALTILSVAALYVFPIVRRALLENTHIHFAAVWVRRVERWLVFTSSERSRIAMTVLCCFVLGILCIHRIALALTVSQFETPTDIYWILFLAWYWVVWTFVLGYLVFRAAKNNENGDRVRSPFFEGLVASLFFYHGLPTKHRIITFTAGFCLAAFQRIWPHVCIRTMPKRTCWQAHLFCL
jgi:hypothetical protein